jgi:hypothetical protein
VAAAIAMAFGTLGGTASVAEAALPVWPAASAFTALPSDADTVAGDEKATLNSVACTSPGDCVAVGAYADTRSTNDAAMTNEDQAMVTTETNGVWGPASKLTLPSDENTTSGGPSETLATLNSVACTGPGSCVAVGDYLDSTGSYQAMVATETGGVWGHASKLTLPSDEQTTAGRQRASLSSVACSGQGDCVAVGAYVATTGFGGEAMVATETGGVWGQASRITLPSDAFPPSHNGQNSALFSVACTGLGDCVTLGDYVDSNGTASTGTYAAMVATETGGVWGQASKLTIMPADYTGYGADFASVTCQSQGNCVAVGTYSEASGHSAYAAMVATETGGVWGQASKLTLPSDASTTGNTESSGLLSVSCTTPGNDCVAVGYYADSSDTFQGMDATETGGVWSQASKLTLPPDASTTSETAASLRSVACTGPGSCVAVGSYQDTAYDTKAMVLSSAAVPLSVLTKTLGNQRITLTTPSLSGCVRNTAKLAVKFTSTTIPRSKSAKLKFSSVAFYIDKGVKHIHHKTVHTHSGKKTITVIVYNANATAHHVPVSLNLSLKGLKAGTHTLTAVDSYTTIKKIHGHKRKVTVTTTVESKFKVC